jgi:hypothetical protein
MFALSRVVMVVVENKWRHAVNTPYLALENKGKLSSTFVHDKVRSPKSLTEKSYNEAANS